MSAFRWATDASGEQLFCTRAGGPTPRWVFSAPFIGTREVGGPCEMGQHTAQSPEGEPMICVGSTEAGEWVVG